MQTSVDESLPKLGLDHVDLFLIHWPLPTRYDGDFVSTWQAMVEVRESGRATSVGVSNFQPEHLNRIVAETGVVPAVNQVEVHPYFANETVRAANVRHEQRPREPLVTDRPGGRARQRDRREDRRRGRPDACPR